MSPNGEFGDSEIELSRIIFHVAPLRRHFASRRTAMEVYAVVRRS